MRLKKEGGEWMWIEFKYERLNIFFFICGLLGNTEKLCLKLYDCDLATITRSYRQWMKAPNRRNVMAFGERRLRSRPLEDGDTKDGRYTTSSGLMKFNVMNPIISNSSKHRGDYGV